MADSTSGQVLVVIVGVTGAGKTTFASVASGRSDLGVGDGIDPYTQEPQAINMKLEDRHVVLIDTPGFDDDVRTDLQILEDIASWLAKNGYLKGRRLDGLILLHPITQDFEGTMEHRRTRILEKILGKDAYRRVIVATTMWDVVLQGFEKEMQANIQRRWETKGGVWNQFNKGGARLVKHDNTRESALRILRLIIERSDENLKNVESANLLIDQELTNGTRLEDTSVGIELRMFFENEIGELQKQLLDHRFDRPPDYLRKSNNATERRRWYEWERQNKALKAELKYKEKQLRRLKGFHLKFAQAWSRLFGNRA